jgi:hypothetical protein
MLAAMTPSLRLGHLPKVNGRHKNRPLAAMRRHRAMQLIAEGKTYREVAAELGYSNPGTVHRLVGKAMREYEHEAVEEHLEAEVARLDALQASAWDRAMSGEIGAMRLCRQLILDRVKLRRLDEVDLAPTKARTVVVDPADLVSGKVNLDEAFV